MGSDSHSLSYTLPSCRSCAKRKNRQSWVMGETKSCAATSKGFILEVGGCVLDSSTQAASHLGLHLHTTPPPNPIRTPSLPNPPPFRWKCPEDWKACNSASPPWCGWFPHNATWFIPYWNHTEITKGFGITGSSTSRLKRTQQWRFHGDKTSPTKQTGIGSCVQLTLTFLAGTVLCCWLLL